MHRMFGKGYAGGGERQCLTFGLSADVFVVASSMLNRAPVKVRCWASNLVTGSQKLPLLFGEAGSTLNLRV